jgi:colicin import membrane protein
VTTSTLELFHSNPYARRGGRWPLAFILSVGFHVALVAGFSLKAYFSNKNPLVIENSIRVDLVALPDKLPAQLPTEPEKKAVPQEAQTPPVAEPQPVPIAPVTKPNPESLKKAEEKNKRKEQDALKKLQQLEAIEQLKNKMTAEEKLKKAAQTFKGNQISSGTELKGLTAVQHDNYVGLIKKKIYANWALPQWLAHKQLAAQVVVQVDDQGNIVGKKMYKSSGNPAYDDAVLESVMRSSPLPKPPESLAKLLLNEGLLVGFPE